VLVAGASSSKRIINLSEIEVYSKTARSSFIAKLSIFCCASGGGVGEEIATVEFAYRVTDLDTNAGALIVLSNKRFPNTTPFIRGLYFLSGVAGSVKNFGIAMVGGNFGASPPTNLAVSLEITALTFTNNTVRMSKYGDISYEAVAITADDVTNAKDLFAVPDTVYTI